jgi:hypothetical protein
MDSAAEMVIAVAIVVSATYLHRIARTFLEVREELRVIRGLIFEQKSQLKTEIPMVFRAVERNIEAVRGKSRGDPDA